MLQTQFFQRLGAACTLFEGEVLHQAFCYRKLKSQVQVGKDDTIVVVVHSASCLFDNSMGRGCFQ